MAQLEAQLQTGGSTKETVAKVSEELRNFREIIFAMLSLLRKQISACSQQIDAIETRHRRKYLIFLGISEDETDCQAATLNTIHKLNITGITEANIDSSHRIGVVSKDHHRPILVKFSTIDSRSAVWRAKSRLKGSSVAVREFLTKPRQLVFSKARVHFGIRACWTQDGVIIVKASDNKRHKITTMDELKSLSVEYPKAPENTDGGTSVATKSRKQ